MVVIAVVVVTLRLLQLGHLLWTKVCYLKSKSVFHFYHIQLCREKSDFIMNIENRSHHSHIQSLVICFYT